MSKELNYQELKEKLLTTPPAKKPRRYSRKEREAITLPSAKERKEIRAAIAEAKARRL